MSVCKMIWTDYAVIIPGTHVANMQTNETCFANVAESIQLTSYFVFFLCLVHEGW